MSSQFYRQGDQDVIFSEEVLDDICRCLCGKIPEEGGFLFSQHDMIVAKFVWDSEGGTTSASYYPSRNASRIINDTEQHSRHSERHLTFSGVVHSHPKSMSYPSGPDCDAMESLLSLNTNLPFVIAPIVTHGNFSRAALDPHELPLKNLGKISCYYKVAGHQVLRFRRAAKIFSGLPLGRNLAPSGSLSKSQPNVSNSPMIGSGHSPGDWKPVAPYDDIVIAIHEIKKCIGLLGTITFSSIGMLSDHIHFVHVKNWNGNPGTEFFLLFAKKFPLSPPEFVLPTFPDRRIPLSWDLTLAFPERASQFLQELTKPISPRLMTGFQQQALIEAPRQQTHVDVPKKRSPKILIIGEFALWKIAFHMVKHGYLRIYFIESACDDDNGLKHSIEVVTQHLQGQNPKVKISWYPKSTLANKNEFQSIIRHATLVIVSSNYLQSRSETISISLAQKKPIIVTDENASIITSERQASTFPVIGDLERIIPMILDRVKETLQNMRISPVGFVNGILNRGN